VKRRIGFFSSIVVVSFLLLNGCASFNKSHTTNFANQQVLIHQGQSDVVALKLEKKAKKGGRNSVLYALEAGYIYLFQKNYEKSKELFEVALTRINNYEMRAKVTARGVGSGIKAAFGNDMELPYKGLMFEKIMVNTFQAINYLFLKDIEGANVEIRRAELRQQEAVDKHQKELKKLEEMKEKKNVDNRSVDSVLSNYSVLDEYSSKVVNSFQNGFTYFLGGLVYELNNLKNDAYIDYKKSFNLYKNKVTLEKLILLGNKLNMTEDIGKWGGLYKELYHSDTDELIKSSSALSDSGEVIIIKFSGMVPKKIQQKFSLWTYKKSFNVAFPFYQKDGFYYKNEYVKLNIDGNDYGDTEVAVDFIPIVTKALKEQMPGIITRQAIRLVAKNLSESQAEKRGGLLGELLMKVVNKATERADLRGWYELPANISVLSKKVPSGNQKLTLDFYSGDYKDKSEDMDVFVRKGGCTVVIIQDMSGSTTIHKLEL